MALINISELHPGVRQLTFNRPDKLNALSTPLMAEFDAALDSAAEDPSVRVLVLRGAGGKAFVAGADIAEYQGDKRAEFIAYQMNSRRVFDKLECLPKPVIGAIDGFALGGGLEIALCCDILLVSEVAQLGLPEGRLGLSPGGGGTQRLVRAVGKYAASELMLAGWRMSGQRAFELGVAAEVTDDLDTAVLQRARGCLKIAPLAQAEMKRLMREGLDAPIETAKSYEQEVLFRLYSTADGQEGIDAFLEKRAPEFRGMRMEFDGKTAIVTGGSDGIGRACAERLHQEGASVVIADIDVEQGSALAGMLGDRAIFVETDMRDLAAVQAMADAAVAQFGGIDVLVNNAARAISGLVDEIDEDNWSTVIDINLSGYWRAMRVSVPEMRKRGGGLL